MNGALMRRLRPLVARSLPVVLVVGMTVGFAGLSPSAAAATPPQLDLKVLLIGQGDTDPTTFAWKSALTAEGVPFDLVTATGTSPARTFTLPTLADGDNGHYNGIVIANSPTEYTAAALAPLYAYESTFGVRQLNGYMYPSPALGVTADADGGSRNGMTARLTTAGLAQWPALKGPVPFDTGSFGFTGTITPGAPYTSLIEDGTGRTMGGVYQHPSTDVQAGVSELSLNFNYSSGQLHWLLLAPGLIDWVTQSTHLGLSRNYYGMDVDDLFLAGDEWSSQYQCTPAATEPLDFNCPAGVAGNPTATPAPSLMTPADVTHVVNWQKQTGIRLNLAFNAVGACTGPALSTAAVCTGSITHGATTYSMPGFVVDADAPNTSALTAALLANKSEFNWIIHTWSHAFLGCNSWAPQAVTSITANAAGGAFSAGNLSYKVTAATSYGESVPSAAQAVTVGQNGSVTLTWPEATNGSGDAGNAGLTLAQEKARYTGGTGFWGYNVYRAKADGSYGLVGQVAEATDATAATSYSFTDTGFVPGAAPESDDLFPTASNPGINCTNGGWVPAATIQEQIALDQAFAAANGLTGLPAAQYTQNAVVTGEHSGVENPNMPTALNAVGVTTFAQDASRQPTQYALGNALGIPRYPSNIYYNASNWTNQLNEYNTLYVTTGVEFPGGIGRCVNTPSTTCRATPATKADLIASDSRIMLSHALANDPRPGYTHAPNLVGSATAGEGYTVLDLIDSVLAQYNALHNEPLTQVTDVSAAKVLARQAAWKAAQAGGQVKASVRNGVVTVTNSGTAVDVPLTVPTGTTVNGSAFGQSYAGTRSDWISVGSTPLVLNANVKPAIISTNAAASIVGAPFSATVVTTGSPVPALTVAGVLPTGITFVDNGNGTATLSGTAAAGTGGSYPVTVTATNASGSATQAFTLSNAEAPSITSAAAVTFSTGVARSFTVTTSGFPAATITAVGALPAGVTLTANADGTATVAGTADPSAVGSYPVTLSATNLSGSTASQTLTITVEVAVAPAITSGALAFFTLNQPGAIAVTSTGSPIPTLSLAGTLPAGLTFSSTANGNALIMGTPTVTGTYTLTVTAANGVNPAATQTYTLYVGQAPALTSPQTATFVAGTAGTFTVTTSGYPAPSLGASGLPGGLLLTDNGNGTATIAGTAAAADIGTRSVTLTATNGTGSVTQTLALTVTAAPPVPTAPAAPLIGTATPGNTTATVTWTAPASNGAPITGYAVRVVNATTDVQIGALRPAAAGVTSLVVTGLTNGTAVRFQVQATNAAGTGPLSVPSNVVTPATPPGIPGIGTAAAAGPTTATVRWTVPANGGSAITGYSVKVLNAANVQVGALQTAPAGSTSLVVTGLTTGQTYRFAVAATNAVASGAFSANSNAVALLVPNAPTMLFALSGGSGGAVTATPFWLAPANNAGPAITGYQVVAERVSAAGAVLATTTSAVLPASARSLAMTLPVAGNYRFTVRALNIVGTGGLSGRSNTVAGR